MTEYDAGDLRAEDPEDQEAEEALAALMAADEIDYPFDAAAERLTESNDLFREMLNERWNR